MNTTTNIMSVSSGNVQGSSSGQSASEATSVRSTDRSADSSADAQSKGTFHDVLNKAQDQDASQPSQENVRSASNADTQEAQAAESLSVPAAKQDKKTTGSDKKTTESEKDTLTSADDLGLATALLNAAAGVVLQVSAVQATSVEVQTGHSETVLAGTQTNANTLQTIENSAATTTSSVLASGISGQATAQNVSLEALLPQNMKAAEQNQQLLDMLTAKANGAATLPGNVATTTVATTGLQPAAASINLSNTTNTVSPSDVADNSSKVNSLLNGASLVVEDHTNQSGLMQQNMGQQMADSRKQGNAFVQTAGQADVQEVVDAGGSRVRQLSEEADFDAAPVKSNASAVSDNPSGLSVSANTFQQNLQDVAGTSAQTEVSQPQTDYDVPQQIVDQARLIKSTDNTEMVIKLKPEHLGDLTLKVSVTANGAVNASFHSDNAQVRTIIENSMVQLRQELQAQGLKVDNVGVYAGLGDGSLMNSQQQGQAAYQQPNQTTAVRSEKVDLAAFEEETDTLTAVSPSAASMNDGVDYRI